MPEIAAAPRFLASSLRASHFRLYFEQPIPPEVTLMPVPESLERAVPRRQFQFRAGRYCAAKAIEALDDSLEGHEVRRASNGAPVWPDGLTGSITHTDDFACAAVARLRDAASLGIDTERIMSDAQAQQVADLVASTREVSCARDAGFTELEALTLIFSAKESVFKCVHPMTGRFFDFRDVCIDRVDARDHTFTARLVQELSRSFPAGTSLQGSFEMEWPWIHTGIALPPVRAGYHRPSSDMENRVRV
jgi:enterobactin synthetase component D